MRDKITILGLVCGVVFLSLLLWESARSYKQLQGERSRHCETVATTLSALQGQQLFPRDFHLLLTVVRSDVFYCVRPAEKAEALLNDVIRVKDPADVQAALERLRAEVQP